MESEEIKELVLSVVVITLAFTMANWVRNQNLADLPPLFLISLISVGTGFVFHELAHRAVARHYGAFATFKAWTTGLALALMTSVFGMVFAAPGAVYIFGRHLSLEQNGKISLAGPAVNLLLAIIFLAIFMFSRSMDSLIPAIAGSAFTINAWLGLFNMIPIYPLDGQKILAWSPIAWGGTALALFFLVFGLPML
ncbi:TPA: site-2 protease family protein [Candidatus Micrarchaeota archaeon]|nr:MAG: hypothetical protein AUJ65_05960 [Candidatus Micrarchaeota archaeon CG1_02_51_15]HII39271.1 site-2 protease family protein [Candidatus Micrarchaeota archaeon]